MKDDILKEIALRSATTRSCRGPRYTEMVRNYESDDDLDHIYKIAMRG